MFLGQRLTIGSALSDLPPGCRESEISVCRLLRKGHSNCVTMCRKIVEAYRGMIKQKASLLVTETKLLCGFTRRLLSSASGTVGVATMHKTITDSRTISVRAIMMRYNLANGRKFVDRELS